MNLHNEGTPDGSEYQVDVIDVHGYNRHNSPEGRFFLDLVKDLDIGLDSSVEKEYVIRSIYTSPLRPVEILDAVGVEGMFERSKSGLRVINYDSKDLCDRTYLHEEKTQTYNGILEILKQGKISVF